MKKSHGFTLIELLVVIAIIGILSSVVLSNLNLARAKAADGSIKANLAGIRAQSEIYYDTNLSFGTDMAAGDCPDSGGTTMFVLDNVAKLQIDDAELKSGSGVIARCAAGNGLVDPDGSQATSWAVSVPFKSDPTQIWCVSSSGGGVVGTAEIVNFEAVCEL